MTELAFLSPDQARSAGGFEPQLASPLARILADTDRVRDLSHLGKIEVRGEVDFGEVDAEIIRITPRRALLLCDYERCAEIRSQLDGFVVDMTGALAGMEVEGRQTMHRLTDLDLSMLPAVGKVAEVPAVVVGDGERFSLFFPQEYAHYVGEVVLDTLEGLWR